jgi:putative phosphoesterase
MSIPLQIEDDPAAAAGGVIVFFRLEPVAVKIGIMSDSHDHLAAIAKAVSIFNDAEVSLVLHAGDLVSPFVASALQHLRMGMVAVFGNNDGERIGLAKAFPDRIFRPPHRVTVEGRALLLLHEPDLLENLAGCGDFHAIIYGHTHVPEIKQGRTLVINPGECCGYLTGRRTVALWDLEKGRVDLLPC